MTIQMVVKRITQDRSMAAAIILTGYIPKLLRKKFNQGVWYKRYLLWFVLMLIGGMGIFYFIRRYV